MLRVPVMFSLLIASFIVASLALGGIVYLGSYAAAGAATALGYRPLPPGHGAQPWSD